MINADPFFALAENGQETMLLPGETRMTDAVIEQLKKHRIEMITILSDKPPDPKPQKNHSIPEHEDKPVTDDKPPAPVVVSAASNKPPATIILAKISDKPPVLRTVPEIGDKLHLPRVEPKLNEKLQRKAIESVKEMYAVAAGSSMTTAHQVVKELDNVVDQLVASFSERSSVINCHWA